MMIFTMVLIMIFPQIALLIPNPIMAGDQGANNKQKGTEGNSTKQAMEKRYE